MAHNLRELADVERYGREAMALAERTENQALVADAGMQWAIYLGVTGRLPEAQTHWDRCIPLARSSANRSALASGLTYQGVKHFWESEYEAAEATQLEAAGLAAEIRDGFYLPLALFYLGLTRANRGRISEAMASLEEALDLAKRNNNAVALSRVPNGFGWVWREIGDLGKAIEFNNGSVEFSRRSRAAEAESNALINLVYDYLLAGQAGKAAGALESVQPLYERERWNRWRFYEIRHQAAEAELRLVEGKLDRAGEHARVLLDNAGQVRCAQVHRHGAASAGRDRRVERRPQYCRGRVDTVAGTLRCAPHALDRMAASRRAGSPAGQPPPPGGCPRGIRPRRGIGPRSGRQY